MKPTDYQDDDPIIRLLTPRVYPPTPAGIKQGVLGAIQRKKRNQILTTMRRMTLPFAVAATIAVGVMLLGRPTSSLAAERVIDNSLRAIEGVQSMTMTIDVRTRPNENFDFSHPLLPMVEHTLTLVRTPKTLWRLERAGGRTIVFDGNRKYMWSSDKSMSVKGVAADQFEGWFDVLLDPERLLLVEKATLQAQGADYQVSESDGQVILTAKVKARGDFSHTYMRNTSLGESDTRRELRFDKATGLLLEAKIWVGTRVVVEIKEVDYNPYIDRTQLVALPQDVEWRDVNAPIGKQFAGITPEEAARRVLTAFERKELSSVSEALPYYNLREFDKYLGIKTIEIGDPFRSGMYAGVFVPCRVRMPNGRIKRYKLALRNDNESQAWILDGGL